MGLQKYQVCPVCGRTLKKNIENFKKYAHKTEDGLNFHQICRECEQKIEYNKEWKDGKLLCHICGKYYDPSVFHLAGGNKYSIRNGRDTRCPTCKALQNKQARLNYSDEKQLYTVLQKRWFGAKRRAGEHNIPFTITKEDLLELWNKQEGKCAISKIPMTYELDQGRIFTNVSVDQIEPKKGYTKENIQLICMAVNQLKSDFDMNTILYICKQIIQNYDKQ